MSFLYLSQFYKNFSELYSSGIDPLAAIETLKKNEKNLDRIQSLQLIAHGLKNGRSLFQSFKNARLIPVLDLPILKAGEESGRLVDIFKTLSENHLQTYQAVKKVQKSLLIPYLTLMAGLLLPGIGDLIAQKISLFMYLKGSLGFLIVVTALFYFVYNFWMQSFFDIEKARTIYQVLKALPIMGRLNFQLSLQKLSSSLAMMLESSLDFFESLKQSGLCSTEIKIQQAIDRIIPKVRSGIELELAFKDEPIFPSEFTTALSLGAQSGKIPEFLNRYSNGLKIQIDSTIKSLVKWFPIAIYWMIIIQMAFAFVGFYKSYLENLLKLAP